MPRYIDADKIRYEEKENIDGYVYSEVVSRNKIDSMPIEDVKPVIHAKWVQVDDNKERCSNGETIYCRDSYPYKRNNYCPNCGAKMEE